MKLLERVKLKFENNPNIKTDFAESALRLAEEDSDMRVMLYDYIVTNDDLVEEHLVDEMLSYLQTRNLY